MPTTIYSLQSDKYGGGIPVTEAIPSIQFISHIEYFCSCRSLALAKTVA